MFDRLLEFIKDLPVSGLRERNEKISDDDPRLAVAALFFHIMDVDGDAHDSERAKLSALLSQKYALQGEELKKFIRNAETADQEATSFTEFTSVLKRHLDYPARLDFLALMWEIVYADGVSTEVETDAMWRIAQLIDINEHDRNAVQQQVEQASQKHLR